MSIIPSTSIVASNPGDRAPGGINTVILIDKKFYSVLWGFSWIESYKLISFGTTFFIVLPCHLF